MSAEAAEVPPTTEETGAPELFLIAPGPPGTEPSVLTQPNLMAMVWSDAKLHFERTYFAQQLQAVGGSIAKLSKVTDVERTHLYRKLRDLGVRS